MSTQMILAVISCDVHVLSLVLFTCLHLIPLSWKYYTTSKDRECPNLISTLMIWFRSSCLIYFFVLFHDIVSTDFWFRFDLSYIGCTMAMTLHWWVVNVALREFRAVPRLYSVSHSVLIVKSTTENDDHHFNSMRSDSWRKAKHSSVDCVVLCLLILMVSVIHVCLTPTSTGMFHWLAFQVDGGCFIFSL